MKIVQHFCDAKTGEMGVREVEMPGIVSAEEGAARAPAEARAAAVEELKAQMRDVLVEEALGLDVTARKKQLCDTFAALR